MAKIFSPKLELLVNLHQPEGDINVHIEPSSNSIVYRVFLGFFVNHTVNHEQVVKVVKPQEKIVLSHNGSTYCFESEL